MASMKAYVTIKMRENTVEKHLRKLVEKLGGIAPKFVSPGNNGMPDRLMIFNKRVAFVETKAPKGRLSPIQKVQIKRLAELGQKVYVAYTIEMANEVANHFYNDMGDLL